MSDGLLFCLHLRYRSDSDKTTALRQLKIITSHHSVSLIFSDGDEPMPEILERVRSRMDALRLMMRDLIGKSLEADSSDDEVLPP